jgi:hypothetical protein
VVQEARNMDCPIGFARGQNGVSNELPPALEAEGILPAWKSDTLGASLPVTVTDAARSRLDSAAAESGR